MINIYDKYKIKPNWRKWAKFKRINSDLQQAIWSKKLVNEDIFALLIVLEDHYQKWYDLTLRPDVVNSKVEQKIEQIHFAIERTNFSEEELKKLTTESFLARSLLTILIRILGLDYLRYSEGLRTNEKVSYPLLEEDRNLVLFATHVGLYYAIPIFLIFQSFYFLPLLIATVLYNVLDSYRWTKMYYYINLIRGFLHIAPINADQ